MYSVPNVLPTEAHTSISLVGATAKLRPSRSEVPEGEGRQKLFLSSVTGQTCNAEVQEIQRARVPCPRVENILLHGSLTGGKHLLLPGEQRLWCVPPVGLSARAGLFEECGEAML